MDLHEHKKNISLTIPSKIYWNRLNWIKLNLESKLLHLLFRNGKPEEKYFTYHLELKKKLLA